MAESEFSAAAALLSRATTIYSPATGEDNRTGTWMRPWRHYNGSLPGVHPKSQVPPCMYRRR